jgi:outer membrane protein assembly factor BamB
MKNTIWLLLIISLFWSCDNYQDQFVNKEKIKLPPSSISKRDLDAGDNYASSPWPTAHRDVRNSDYTPFYTTADIEFSWIDLKYAGFFIGPTIGPEGNVYLPTGYGAGYSNLTCFDRYGNKLWESEKLEKGKELEGVDWGCEINAPIIDKDGNVYQADWNQIWSFTNTGELRWVSNLRDFGIEGMFITPFFLKNYIGGSSTDGYLAFFDVNTGEFFDKLKLPGTKGPKSLTMFDGLWETQMAPEMRQFAWDAVFGCNMQCSNTPAVNPETGRVFVVANGNTEDEGVIHGVDLTPDGLKLAFTTSTGLGGSGTSPSITFDGKIVVLTDGDGYFNGVDTETGKIVWRNDTESVNGVSSTTAPNGMAINYSTNLVTAYDALTGELLWETDLDVVVADKDMKGLVARKSTPSAVAASNVMATPDKIWMIVLSCAKMELSEKQKEKNNMIKIPVRGIPKDSVRIPQRYYLCSFDYNGNLLSKTPAPGDGAMITAGLDGRIYVSGLSVVSDIVYNQTPSFFRTTPKPTPGVWGFEPKSFKQQAKEALAYLAKYCRKDASLENIRKLSEIHRKNIALEQLDGIRVSLKEAVIRKELAENKAEEIIEQLSKPSQLIETGEYIEAASEIEKVLGAF